MAKATDLHTAPPPVDKPGRFIAVSLPQTVAPHHHPENTPWHQQNPEGPASHKATRVRPCAATAYQVDGWAPAHTSTHSHVALPPTCILASIGDRLTLLTTSQDEYVPKMTTPRQSPATAAACVQHTSHTAMRRPAHFAPVRSDMKIKAVGNCKTILRKQTATQTADVCACQANHAY